MTEPIYLLDEISTSVAFDIHYREHFPTAKGNINLGHASLIPEVYFTTGLRPR